MAKTKETAKKTSAFSKRLRSTRENWNRHEQRALEEAIKLVKQNATAKFDETIELVVSLGIDTKQSDQQVRGMHVLPHGTGKSVRVAVFAKGPKAEEAKKAGADVVGAEDLMEKVQKGEIDFERCIATPDMMPVVGRLGQILGPRGLMPNPKLGTVTMDVATAVNNAKGGAVEFRAEKAGIVHVGVGKASFTDAKLAENIRSLYDALLKAKPQSSKGVYIKKASLSSTMGVGVRLDTTTLSNAA